MTRFLVLSVLTLGTHPAGDGTPARKPTPLSAHNCYLANRHDNPRLAEALRLGIDNVEIDLGWDPTARRLIVGHDASPRPGVAYPEFEGTLIPALEAHWAHPRVDGAPTVLTVDWKTDRPEAVQAFHSFLDAHADWFSSAEKPEAGANARPGSLTPRRLTVCLTGSEAAKDAYDALIPPGGTYRAFRDRVYGAGSAYRDDVAELVPGPATAYHRFLTYHWGVVERGAPFSAGDWTAEESDRLSRLVDLAHRQGYRLRVYCLNGQTGPALGGYRFRTVVAAQTRWLAAANAGVDWVATDEYSEAVACLSRPEEPTASSIRRVTDLDPGESRRLTLADGSIAEVTLVSVKAVTDPLRSAVRSAAVQVVVNGEAVTLGTGNYLRPVTVGEVQIDCPVVGDYRANSGDDHWGLEKAARLRLWPAGSAWIEPGTFQYPARQKWFATMTQMANEPVYVDGGEVPSNKRIYYHSGLDIGGAEGLVEVVAATDGLVVSRGLERLPGHDDSPVQPRYDVVYLLDARGWYYRYSHLATIDPAVKVGDRVTMGQKIGMLGKEGGSGGWSHLHFEIKSRQPSGKWGTEEGYAFLWEAATREQNLELVAVARPHRFVKAGERVVLDGGGSWSRSGDALSYDWTFTEGGAARGAVVEKVYPTPGAYSEILKVTDARGQVAYDFAVVQVVDPDPAAPLPPTIHAAYFPTLGIQADDPVTFKVRTFRVGRDGARETWDFGDGTPPVSVQSDGNAKMLDPDGYAVTTHRYARPGDYLVRVQRANRQGNVATARLHVRIEPR
ncbi:MAG: PKD domain-containing protein [Isosphaeraceae bacterium]